MFFQDRPGRSFQLSDLPSILGVALLYIIFAKVGLALAIQAAQVTSVWPPTGFAVAAVLRLGRRGLFGVFIGAFIANATAAEPLAVAAGIAAGNTLEALAAAILLRVVGFDRRLARVRDVIALLAVVFTAPLISASIGVTCLVMGKVQPASELSSLWWLWWLGDALGGLLVAPVLLVWKRGRILPRRPKAAMEAVLLLGGLLLVSWICFIHSPKLTATEYVVFPFLIWAGLRFGPPGVASATLACNVVAVWGTHLGRGPFFGAGPEQGLLLLQIFMAIAATTGLLLGAVTAQNQRAQEHAQMSERRLLLAMGAAPIGVWDWNINTGEMAWSEDLEPMHGLTHDEFAGTYEAYRDLIHPEDRERVDAAAGAAIRNATRFEATYRIRGADGVDRWVDARGQPVADERGNVVRMVGVGIDITRQKELEEELRRHATEMTDADRRKDEFLAMLGHELRNPLAPIVHSVDLLELRDPMLAGEARQIIRRQSEHLTRLVGDLLDVSRITRGSVKLERRRVTLRDVVLPAVETWRHLIIQRHQHLILDIPERPIWLDVDPTRFTQIVANLLHNAAKFTADEGRIFLTVREEHGRLVMRVRDNGQGMTDEIRARAFDIFVQGTPSLDRSLGGLGLGLALVRSLTELHGGTVEVKSDGPGRGCEFTLSFPIASPPEDTGETTDKPLTPYVSRARRILLVEDNPDARKALELLLEEEGHVVRTAGDGTRALAEAETFRPEVVLLDIGLPGIDGYAVARRLRAMPQCAEALLIAITGYGQSEDRAQSAAAGFDHHLLKPVERGILLELLR